MPQGEPMQSWPQAPSSASDGVEAQRRVRYALMTHEDLDAVHSVEKTAYGQPWSHKHFRDSIDSDYLAVMLLGEPLPGEMSLAAGPHQGRVLLGYLVAMMGVEEVHLLNVTVAPAMQRKGWGRVLMDGLILWSRGQQAHSLWLEVRESNTGARALYESMGFRSAGLRKDYYPAGQGRREHAVVMQLSLDEPGIAADARMES